MAYLTVYTLGSKQINYLSINLLLKALNFMQKFAFLCIVLIVMSFFSSCFNFTEEITLKKNGSGMFKRTIDMSEMMGMLATFMPDSLKGSMDLSKELNMDDMKSKFIGMNGISNVKSSFDKAGIIELSFDFKNVDALNKAIATDSGSTDMAAQFGQTSDKYVLKKHCISRKSMLGSDMKELGGFNLEENKEMLEMFNPPSYKLVYHLPSKAKKVNAKEKDAKVSKDGQTVSIELNLMDLITGDKKEMLNHEIKF